MSTTKALETRLERLEDFVKRLTLGSYVAKAADQGLKVANVPLSSGDQVLAQTVRSATKRRTELAIAEDTLAKAVGNFSDPEALLSYADRHIDDVTTVGIVSGHLAAGDLMSAKQTVLEYAQRASVVAKADDVSTALGQITGDLDGDLASYDSKAAVSEMTARFGVMERTIAALEARLAQLERRPQAAPAPVVPPAPNTVAKAAGSKRPRTHEETAEELLSQISAYVDSPTTVGQLSSMVHARQYREVRAAIASAKRSHEERKAINERNAFTLPSSSLTPR